MHSKFGRSFSIIRIPYALKLLIQELQVLNVQMRIITEQNVDQLLNLSYQSNNIHKLLHIDETDAGKSEIKTIIDNYKIETNALSKQILKERSDFNMKQSELYNNTMNPVPQGVDEAEFLRQQQMERQQMQQMQQANLEAPGKWSDSPIDESKFQWNFESPNPSPSPNAFNEQNQMGQWQPQDEFPTTSSSVSLRQDFPDSIMKEEWSRLPSDQQKEISNLPLDEQITIMKQIISNKPALQQQQLPNYGDVELQGYFTMLPKEEQIELLKLSHERQIDKLKQMATDYDNSKVQTVIPKTAAEELYEGKLGLLAPVSEKKSDSVIKNDSENSNSNSNSNSNNDSSNNSSETKGGIRKIIF
jgi:hypothetical protein